MGLGFSLKCCCENGCAFCHHSDNNRAACCFGITLSGIATGSCLCHFCPELNGEYTVSGMRISEASFPNPPDLPAGSCYADNTIGEVSEYWLCPEYSRSDTDGIHYISLEINESGGDYFVTVSLRYRRVTLPSGLVTPGSSAARWQKNYGTTRPNASSLVTEELTFLDSDGRCDYSASTCHVTSNPVASSAECPPRAEAPVLAPGCSDCIDRRIFEQVLVTIPDQWTSTSGLCTTCSANLSGAFLLERLGDQACSYGYSLTPTSCQSPPSSFTGCRCGYNGLSVTFTDFEDPITEIRIRRLDVVISTSSFGSDACPCGGFHVRWSLDLPAGCNDDTDCVAGSPWAVPFASSLYTSCACSQACHWDDATAVTVEGVI